MENEGRLDEILTDWRARQDRGEYIDPEEIVRTHPDLAEPLRVRFAALAALDEVLSERDSAHQPMPEHVGIYKLVRRLGEGGMGTVYLASSESDEQVALKILHSHLLARPGFFKRFLREAEAGRKIEHENVVRTLDVDAALVDGIQTNFLVMEFVEGKTLNRLLEELEVVPEALLREIARQASAGLAAIHTHGIVHRDIKPENVILTPENRIRIMDLGVARIAEDSLGLTKAGEFAGSLHYAAPEQFGDKETGPAADLYSLGILLYELATGMNPFRWDDVARVIAAHTTETPIAVAERNDRISRFLSELIGALLEKAPQDRPSSAHRLFEILAEGESSEWWKERSRKLHLTGQRLPRVQVRRETHLYGREADLDALQSAWQDACNGQGRTMLLEGEAGIGKTRLVDAFLQGMNTKDCQVLYGSYAPSGGVGGLATALFGHFGEAGLNQSLEPYLPETRDLVPAFSAYLTHGSTPATGGDLGAEAVHTLMVQLAKGIGAEGPLLWIVDDLHFASKEERKLTLSLARALEGRQVFLLLTTRPGLPAEELSNLGQVPGFQRRVVLRLSPRQVMLMLQDAFRSEKLADKLGARIALKSDGIPFFVFEMIRGLEEGQFITKLPDGSYVETRVIEDIQVPSAVRELVEARLSDVSDELRSILDVGAVAGFEFDPEVVAEVLHIPYMSLLQQLARVERRHGIVLALDDRIRFDHHQIQETLYQDMPPALRREYHRAVAEVLEQHPLDGPGKASVAEHHVAAGRREGALPHLEAALKHLASQHQHERIITLAEAVLAEPDLLTASMRCEIIDQYAPALAAIGRIEAASTAREEAVRVADDWGDLPARIKTRRSLAYHWTRWGPTDQAEPVLSEARDIAKDSRTRNERSGVHYSFGFLYYYQERFAEAWQELEQARIKLPGNDSGLLRDILHTMSGVALKSGDLEQSMECSRRSLEIARERGRRTEVMIATGQLGTALVVSGRMEDAAAALERAAALATQVGDRGFLRSLQGNLAVVHMNQGRFSEALDLLSRSLDQARELGARDGEAITLRNLGTVYAHLGDPAEARARLSKARELAVELRLRYVEGNVLTSLSEVANAEGKLDDSTRLMEEAIHAFVEIGDSHSMAQAHYRLGALLFARGAAKEATRALVEARDLAAANGAEHITVSANCWLAASSGSGGDEATRLLGQSGDRLAILDRIEAHYALWRYQHDREQLAESHRLLLHLQEHAPEEYRASMLRNVRINREIMEAWEANQ